MSNDAVTSVLRYTSTRTYRDMFLYRMARAEIGVAGPERHGRDEEENFDALAASVVFVCPRTGLPTSALTEVADDRLVQAWRRWTTLGHLPRFMSRPPSFLVALRAPIIDAVRLDGSATGSLHHRTRAKMPCNGSGGKAHALIHHLAKRAEQPSTAVLLDWQAMRSTFLP